MAGKINDQVNNMIGSIGAMQTLLQNFPISSFSFGDIKFSTSFDVIEILFKLLGVDREEVIDMFTEMLCGNNAEDSKDDDSGFISVAENMVKSAIELNLIGLLNCGVNPIISNKLLDKYSELNIEKSGDGILLNVSEIDFTGVLNRNPLDYENGSKFYFDLQDEDGNEYNASTIWKSKDFNAYLWYIINKSDKFQEIETIWDNRLTDKTNNRKEILRCTYIDDSFPNSDKIKVQICGGRKTNGNDLEPANYYKTRKISKNNSEFSLNKTIFEFNHDFLSNIKLYDKKVIVAEIIEYFFGRGNGVNIGFSINEEIIQGKIQNIISNVVEADDMEVEDCFFSFSNDEYNDMLEKSEKNRYNIVNINDDYIEVDTNELLNHLTNENKNGVLVTDKNTIKKTFQSVTATTAQDSSSNSVFSVGSDWEFDIMRMIVYPFVRPLFTPKVMFLLLVNKKIMGSFSENESIDRDTMLTDLMNSIFVIIKDITKKLKDMIIDVMLVYVLEKLTPLLSLFASRLMLESLKMYKDLLENIMNNCKTPLKSGNSIVGNIDNVNYADIIPIEIKPNQSIC